MANEQVLALLARIAEGVDVQNTLLAQVLAKVTTSAPATATPPYYDFDGEYLEVGFAQGKATYRIFGAQFTKFGITVWPETLSKLGLPSDIAMGRHTFTKRVRTALNEKGQPQKVIGLAE